MSFSVLKATGLFTNGNPLSQNVPEGALWIAEDVVIRSKDVISPRPGFVRQPNTTGTIVATAFYGGAIVSYDGTTLTYTTGGSYTTISGSYTATAPSTLRMKFAEANQNLYFNTTVGTYGLSALTGTPAKAGIARPRDIATTIASGLGGTPGGTSSWLPKNTQVAYRILYGIRDVNNNLKLGPPSSRLVVVNPNDLTLGVGAIGKTASAVATVTNGTAAAPHGFQIGDSVTVNVGADANFPTGNYTVLSVTATTFTYNDATVATATSANTGTVTSGTKKTDLVFSFPSDVPTTSTYFVQVYRTAASSGATVDPGDEMHQIYEKLLVSGSTSINFIDTTPDTTLYANPLYSNARSGSDPYAQHFQPPIGQDMCLWQERLWWGNTKSKHSYRLQALGTGSPDGIQANDLFAVGGLVFKAAATIVNTTDFQVFSSFNTPSQNLLATTTDLARAIYTTVGQTSGGALATRGFYDSFGTDAPGKLWLEEDQLGGSTFYVAGSRAATWSPVLPTLTAVTAANTSRTSNVVTVRAAGHGFTTGDTIVLACQLNGTGIDANFHIGTKTPITVTDANNFTYAETGSNATLSGAAGTYYVHNTKQYSDNFTRVNGLWYSMAQQPEAVAPTNYLAVGSKSKNILRIVPLRDRLFVFKQDGLFTISGSAPDYSVDLLDSTIILTTPDTAVPAFEKIAAFTNQGLLLVAETGSTEIGYPIRADIAIATPTACFTNPAHHELLVCVDTPTYVYNHSTDAWTEWYGTAARISDGGLNPADNKVYIATGTSYSYLADTGNATDYADVIPSYTTTATAGTAAVSTSTYGGTGGHYGTATITLVSVAHVGVGDLLIVDGNYYGLVTAINGNVVTVAGSVGFATFAGTVSIRTAYRSRVVWLPTGAGAPANAKQFGESVLHFKTLNANAIGTTFDTDLVNTTPQLASTTTTISSSPTAFAAGLTAYPFMSNRRCLVPLEKQRASFIAPGFLITEAGSSWALIGYTLSTLVGGGTRK